MVHAFIMAKVEAGRDKEIFSSLGRISGIRKAYSTYGTYDLIIEANLNTVEELDEFDFLKFYVVLQGQKIKLQMFLFLLITHL